jgi:sugar phosphate isomerase/epimerase
MPLGIDLFSIRDSNYSPFAYLDYCAKLGANLVHFSEIRFLGNLEPAHLKQVRTHAEKLGISLEIGMRSICPTSKAFDSSQGSAEAQIMRMVQAAREIGAPIVRAFLGTSADRTTAGGIESHIEQTVRVLRAVRARVQDAGIKIAIENHAGDMQGRELRTLIEQAGKDFVGACLDSGNPLWAIEDPHLTLELLAPYVLTSHIRDTLVYRSPEGVHVAWTRMGNGNIDIAQYLRTYVSKCPGKPISLEIIVTGPRAFPIHDPKFWEGYRNTPAWEFMRFLNLADQGKPPAVQPGPPKDRALQAQAQREDLEASFAWTKQFMSTLP